VILPFLPSQPSIFILLSVYPFHIPFFFIKLPSPTWLYEPFQLIPAIMPLSLQLQCDQLLVFVVLMLLISVFFMHLISVFFIPLIELALLVFQPLTLLASRLLISF